MDGDLARSLGMLVKKDNLGFGLRSWRYAMLVVNGTVELFCPEPNLTDNAQEDPYGNSSPAEMLTEVQVTLRQLGLDENSVEEVPSVDLDSTEENV